MDEIKLVITASSSRKTERAERTKAEDFDAEEGELLKEENEQEEEVFEQVSFCVPSFRCGHFLILSGNYTCCLISVWTSIKLPLYLGFILLDLYI